MKGCPTFGPISEEQKPYATKRSTMITTYSMEGRETRLGKNAMAGLSHTPHPDSN